MCYREIKPLSVGRGEADDMMSFDDDLGKAFNADKVVVSGLSPELSANSPTAFTVDTRHAGPAQLDVNITVCQTSSLTCILCVPVSPIP